ncbi:zinc finger MYND domain-containing protein 11 [Ciona intestinalis]
MDTEIAYCGRRTNPKVVLQLYSAIEMIRKQRQIANIQRVVRVMEKDNSYTPTEILHHIHNAVLDRLVIETITVGCKGSKLGVEQEGYWIPDPEQLLPELVSEKRDWYCFRCHEAGTVIPCTSCSFVYHPDCLTIMESKNLNSTWKCPWCNTSDKQTTKRERIELGRCLHFVATQQKDLMPELNQKPSKEICSFYNYFIHTHYDLTMLQKDCQNCVFSSVDEFQAKVELISHNFSVVFGENHKLTKLTKQVIEECQHDLVELRLCQNCFHLSNTKPVKEWFCKPCQPPHQVVWAKQKGFEFWPAKVIRVEDNRIDVRFFGKQHPRAWVGADAVRAITVSPAQLKVKKKPQWKQANDEMQEYIRQCECDLGKEKAAQIILVDSPFGIGKNKPFLSSMMKVNKNGENCGNKSEMNGEDEDHAHDAHDTLDVHDTHDIHDAPDFPVYNDDEKEEQPQATQDALVLQINDIGDEIKTDSPLLLEDSVITKLSVMDETLKRSLSTSSDESTQPKKLKVDSSPTVAEEPTAKSKYRDVKIQVNYEELCGKACSCKFRYGAILEKFKDYLVESNHLQQAKLMRSVSIKASFAQQDAELNLKNELEAQYNEQYQKLKEEYEEKIIEAKKLQWCALCGEKADVFCCRNTNYCSTACMDKHRTEHSTLCISTKDGS